MKKTFLLRQRACTDRVNDVEGIGLNADLHTNNNPEKM